GIVLVGSTAIAAFDHYPTPFTSAAPGTEVHSNVIDNILNRRELRSIHGWLTLLLVFPFAFFSAWTLFLAPLTSALLVIGVLAAWIIGNVYAFHHYWTLQFTAPTVALIGPFLILFVRRTLLEHREKRFVTQ